MTMERYAVITIGRTIDTTEHVYSATRTGARNTGEFSGDFACATVPANESPKILTDFLFMPNTRILSVMDKTRRGTLTEEQRTFTIGERTQDGVISKFIPNRNHISAFLNNARVNGVNLTQLRKPVPVVVPNPLAADANVQTSRSTTQASISADIAALETQIKSARDIRLEKLFKKTIPATVEEFLIKFFKAYNAEKNTIYVDDRTVQTTVGRRRSLGDIYKLCKYYYPNITLKEILVFLYKTLPAKLNPGFRTSYCTTIKKRVWYYSAISTNLVHNASTNDEYGHTVNWYTTKI